MYAAYPYDLSSTERVEESVTVADAKIFLRHIPKKNSIVIDGFTETQAAVVPQNHFRCDYEDEKSWYRDANRILYVNAAHNGQTLTVSYVAIGTVLTAAIWNEIKRHLDTPHAAQYTLPTASDEVKGGVKVGAGLCMNDDTLNCTVTGGYFRLTMADLQGGDYQVNLDGATVEEICPQINEAFANSWGRTPYDGDIVNIYPPGGSGGLFFGYHSAGRWHLLGNSRLDDVNWTDINPLLSVADRQKLDALENYSLPTMSDSVKGGAEVGNGLKMTGDKLNVALGTTPSTIEGAMWLSV